MTEKKPTIEQLDEMRTTGYRPTVVICCVHDKKVLLLFKKEYRLWMFIQGGVETGEELDGLALRELKEEMGAEFVKTCSKDMTYIGEEQVEFLPEKQTGEELATSDGKKYKMVGKHYYFLVVNVSKEEIDLKKSEFDEYYWLDSKPALSVASKIYQPGKRRITMRAINLLNENGFID